MKVTIHSKSVLQDILFIPWKFRSNLVFSWNHAQNIEHHISNIQVGYAELSGVWLPKDVVK